MSGGTGKRNRGSAAGTKASKAGTATVPRGKLHGVITESMVPDQVERSGLYPFTFTSALLLLGSALLGGGVFPWLAGENGRLAALIALPILLAVAMGVSRYFIDSDRGVCPGLWVTSGITLVASFMILYLALFQGILV